MDAHFADEWQRLTRAYAEKTDEELLDLSSDFARLTEPAQQVLRDELRRRRLPDPAATQQAPARPRFNGWSPMAAASSPQSCDNAEPDGTSGLHEYTWKTLLCECRDQEHAWQISEVLKQAGIESWIDGPSGDLDMTSPRVLVAADQLDEARVLAERPIPQDIVDQSKAKDDFTAPVCPKCGAADPMLLGVDPSNIWRCEVCGAQWTDAFAPEKSEVKPAR